MVQEHEPMSRFAARILPRSPEQNRAKCGIIGSKPIWADVIGGVTRTTTNGSDSIRPKSGCSGEDPTWKTEVDEGENIGKMHVSS